MKHVAQDQVGTHGCRRSTEILSCSTLESCGIDPSADPFTQEICHVELWEMVCDFDFESEDDMVDCVPPIDSLY